MILIEFQKKNLRPILFILEKNWVLFLESINSERISWSHITFVDNAACIEMLEGKTSVFSLLDEQCKFAGNSSAENDKKFQDKIKNTLSKNKYLLTGDVKFRNKGFGIAHYAGPVYYNVKDFVEKNKNQVNKEINTIFSQSKNSLLNKIFKEKFDKETTKSVESVSKSFTSQQANLVVQLNNSTPLYIRCIKPNSVQKPDVFESYEICRQLRCAGMLEAIRIRKCGFPVRRKYDAFERQYQNLFNVYKITEKNPKKKTELFMEAIYREKIIDKQKKEVQLGLTKVFMKENVKTIFDNLLEKSIEVFAIRIQKNMKRIVYQKRYARLKKATRHIQNYIRTYITYLGIKKRAKEKLERQRGPTRMIQRAWRNYLFKKNLFANLEDFLMRKRLEAEQQQELAEQFGDDMEEDNPQKSKIENILNKLYNSEFQQDGSQKGTGSYHPSKDVSMNEGSDHGDSNDWLEEQQKLREENKELQEKLEGKDKIIKNKDEYIDKQSDKLSRYKGELNKRNERYKMLEKLNKEFQTKEKLYKDERQKLKTVLMEKDAKQKKAQNAGIDSDFLSKIEMEVDKMKSKDLEIKQQKKKKRDLEFKVAHMSSKLLEISHKDKNVEKLVQELEYWM